MPLPPYDMPKFTAINVQFNAGQDYQSPLWTYYAAGVPVDFSGSAARLMFRVLPTDPSPLLSLTTAPSASGQIVLGGANGQVSFSITRAATAAIFPGAPYTKTCLWELWIDWSNGTSDPILTGSVIVDPSVTH